MNHRPRALVAWLGAAALLGAPLPGQGRTPPPINGQVLRDGRPAAEASVVLRWRTHPELPGDLGRCLVEGSQGQITRTAGADGRFSVPAPIRGACAVVASHAQSSSVNLFPVVPGDDVVLPLEPDFVARGRVLDPDGKPVAGATVEVTAGYDMVDKLEMYRRPETCVATVSGADGGYQVRIEHASSRLPLWSVVPSVRARAGTLISAQVQVRPEHGHGTADLALVAAIGEGQLVGADLALGIDQARLLSLRSPAREWPVAADGGFALPADAEWLYAVAKDCVPARVTEGRVELQRGRKLLARLAGPRGPLANARVLFAIQVTGAPKLEWLEWTGADGELESHAMPAHGAVGAFAEADGRFVQFLTHLEPGPLAMDLGVVRVDPARVLAGRVLDAAGAPVAHARVLLQPQAPGAPAVLNPAPRIAWTGADGAFRFEAVIDRDVTVLVDAGAHGLEHVRVAAADLGAPLTVTLPRGPGLGGRVLRNDGRPAAGAIVFVYRTAMADPKWRNGPSGDWCCLALATDAGGSFRVQGLPEAGSWSVRAILLEGGVRQDATVATAAGAAPLALTLQPTTQR